jgi:hypothetical protein
MQALLLPNTLPHRAAHRGQLMGPASRQLRAQQRIFSDLLGRTQRGGQTPPTSFCQSGYGNGPRLTSVVAMTSNITLTLKLEKPRSQIFKLTAHSELSGGLPAILSLRNQAYFQALGLLDISRWRPCMNALLSCTEKRPMKAWRLRRLRTQIKSVAPVSR